MIGLLKNGQKVEVKKIIPDWNRVRLMIIRYLLYGSLKLYIVLKKYSNMSKMKQMLLAIAAMCAAAQSNDPYSVNRRERRLIMDKLRLIIRLLLTPLWLALFFVYLPIWYIQMSWYYFRFSDYWEGYLLLWDRIMIFLKIK